MKLVSRRRVLWLTLAIGLPVVAFMVAVLAEPREAIPRWLMVTGYLYFFVAFLALSLLWARVDRKYDPFHREPQTPDPS